MGGFSDSVIEDAVPVRLESLGWAVKHGPDIAPGEPRMKYARVHAEAVA